MWSRISYSWRHPKQDHKVTGRSESEGLFPADQFLAISYAGIDRCGTSGPLLVLSSDGGECLRKRQRSRARQ